jgi:hypothetical protein
MGSGIPVNIFPATIIKTDLNDTATALRVTEGQVRQPVMSVEPVTTSAATSAITFTAGRFAVFSGSAITTSHIQKKLTIKNKSQKEERMDPAGEFY